MRIANDLLHPLHTKDPCTPLLKCELLLIAGEFVEDLLNHDVKSSFDLGVLSSADLLLELLNSLVVEIDV